LIAGSLENLQESLSTLAQYVAATDKYLTGSDEISQLRADLRLDRRLADTAGLLEICAEGARRLSHVVEQLRSTALPPAALAGQPSDLRAIVDVAVAMATFGRSSPPLVVPDFEPGYIGVSGNSQSLGQVFLNLVRNACDALGTQADARIDIEARLRRAPEKACFVTVSVRDNGPGIRPEYRDRIFDEGFTTKAEGGGLGLGLSICRALVAAMGGSILLLSPARGTEFLVELPAVLGEPALDRCL
jgi:signal transduction histidine kinase